MPWKKWRSSRPIFLSGLGHVLEDRSTMYDNFVSLLRIFFSWSSTWTQFCVHMRRHALPHIHMLSDGGDLPGSPGSWLLPLDTEHRFLWSCGSDFANDERQPFYSLFAWGHVCLITSGWSYHRYTELGEMAGWYPEYWEWCKALCGMLSDMPHRQNGSQTLRNSLSKPETRGKSKTLVAVHFYAKKKWTLGRWIHVSEQYLPAINVLEPQVIIPILMDDSPIIKVYHHISILFSRHQENQDFT